MTHTERTALDILRKARARWGAAWVLLSKDMQGAYVAREALARITGNERLEKEPAVQAALLAIQEMENP